MEKNTPNRADVSKLRRIASQALHDGNVFMAASFAQNAAVLEMTMAKNRADMLNAVASKLSPNA